LKITDYMLTKIETEKGVLMVQSTFPEIVYGIDKTNRVIWEINRKTGEQRNISAKNVYAYAYELMDVADMFLPVRNIWRDVG
jgi:hypothetical protein